MKPLTPDAWLLVGYCAVTGALVMLFGLFVGGARAADELIVRATRAVLFEVAP